MKKDSAGDFIRQAIEKMNENICRELFLGPDNIAIDWERLENEGSYIPGTTPDSCQHEWVEYYGLKETFTYCKKCDKKQPQP